MNYSFSLWYLVPSVLILIGVRKYRESKWGKCTNKVRLDGKVAVVTGANSGIGYEIAKELAKRGAQVVVVCRSMSKAIEATTNLKSLLPPEVQLIPMELDLGRLSSVDSFAKQLKKDFSQVDILINNAGVAYPRSARLQTSDGFEIHFGINHLGHFYLTNLIEDLLSKAQARVIVVASSLHEKAHLDIAAIKAMEFQDSDYLYAISKLANVYFARELAKRTHDKGIKTYAICPGWVYTGLFRHSFKWFHFLLIAPIAFMFMRSAKQGAQTAIYCATEPALANETGLLYADCKKYISKAIFYDKLSEELWQESQNMVESVMKKSD